MKIVRRTFLLLAVIVGVAAFFFAGRVSWMRRGKVGNSRAGATPQMGPVSIANSNPVRVSAGSSTPTTASPNATRQRIAEDPELRQLEIDLRAAAQIADSDERQAALVEACRRWAQRDPRDAIAIARELQIDQRPGEVLEAIVHIWASADAPTAAAWAAGQPAGEERDRLVARAAFVWSQKDPSSAASFVAAQMPPGSTQDEAVISVVHQWGLRDLSGATAWVNAFPAGPLRERALSELTGLATQHTAPPAPPSG